MMVNLKGVLVVGLIVLLSGCTTMGKAQNADMLNRELIILKSKMEALKKEKDAEIARLKSEKEDEIKRLQKEKQTEITKVVENKTKELSELEKAKLELERKLQSELGAYKAKLEMTERGLVVTFLSEIFFDSGKDTIKPDGEAALKKVAQILNKNVPNSNIAVEGHADNDPIKSSGWRSNWELSSARALAVVHYFVDIEAINPKRLSAVGCSEYRPVKSNETPEGRRQNRRVEIVILPSQLQKVKTDQ